MKYIIGFIVLSFPMLVTAKVYQCEVEGQVTFQSKPCAGVTVGQAQPSLQQNVKVVSDLSKIHLENYKLSFSECKAHVFKMQAAATQQAFKTIVLENTSTSYVTKVCMPPNSSVILACDGMKRTLVMRRRAPCS